MAKASFKSTEQSFNSIMNEIRGGVFRPFYILTGEEPHFADLIIEEIERVALTPQESEFNKIVAYGNDIDSTSVAQAARGYPMMAARKLIIVKEAQLMNDLESIEIYLRQPMKSTILVLSFTSKLLDKREKFYKTITKSTAGFFLESAQLREYEVSEWVTGFLFGKGYKVEREAAEMLAEFCGTELRKLVLEIDKVLINKDSGDSIITAQDVENNVGISRHYNIFELTKALSLKNSIAVYKIVNHFKLNEKKYPAVMVFAILYGHFTRLIRYHSVAMKSNGRVSEFEAMKVGINKFALREFEAAARNYSLKKCISIISYIRKYDGMGKSVQRGVATDGDLVMELVAHILN